MGTQLRFQVFYSDPNVFIFDENTIFPDMDILQNTNTIKKIIIRSSANPLLIKEIPDSIPEVTLEGDISERILENIPPHITSLILKNVSENTIKNLTKIKNNPGLIQAITIDGISEKAIKSLPKAFNTLKLMRISSEALVVLPPHVKALILGHRLPSKIIPTIPKTVSSLNIEEGLSKESIQALPFHIKTIILNSKNTKQTISFFPKQISHIVLNAKALPESVAAFPPNITIVSTLDKNIPNGVLNALPKHVEKICFAFDEITPSLIRSLPLTVKIILDKNGKALCTTENTPLAKSYKAFLQVRLAYQQFREGDLERAKFFACSASQLDPENAHALAIAQSAHNAARLLSTANNKSAAEEVKTTMKMEF